MFMSAAVLIFQLYLFLKIFCQSEEQTCSLSICDKYEQAVKINNLTQGRSAAAHGQYDRIG